MTTEPIYLPDDFIMRELEASKHNATEAFKLGAKSYARNEAKEVTRLRKLINPPPVQAKYPYKPKPKPTAPHSVNFLRLELGCEKHNIQEAALIGADKYCVSSRREIVRLKSLIKKWWRK